MVLAVRLHLTVVVMAVVATLGEAMATPEAQGGSHPGGKLRICIVRCATILVPEYTASAQLFAVRGSERHCLEHFPIATLIRSNDA